MDLNCLLHRHQVSLMRADSADNAEARLEQRGLAHGYADMIRAVQNELGALMAKVQTA